MNDFYNTEYLSERVAALAKERDDARREVRRLNEICERQARLNIVNAKLAMELDQVTAERDALRAGGRRGRWMPQLVLGERAWDCSECKTIGSPRWKCCPVCGARMDGDSIDK